MQVVEEVATAQEAVELLLPQGDFAGALDVLDSLRATLSTHHTAGLHAFRHLPAQLADISEARTSPRPGSLFGAADGAQPERHMASIAFLKGECENKAYLHNPLWLLAAVQKVTGCA